MAIILSMLATLVLLIRRFTRTHPDVPAYEVGDVILLILIIALPILDIFLSLSTAMYRMTQNGHNAHVAIETAMMMAPHIFNRVIEM
ncbi:MAG: hypothetical protein ABI254_16340, partial [Chthoniobacterales bacterium]